MMHGHTYIKYNTRTLSSMGGPKSPWWRRKVSFRNVGSS